MDNYIRKSVMEVMPDPLNKEEDDEEDKQFDTSDPMDWIDDNINNVWEDDDEIIVEIQSEGGETEERSLDSVKGTLYDMFDEDVAEDVCDEIEDMAD